MSIVPETERQLREAAERLAKNPVSRALDRSRRWRGRFLTRPLVIGLAIVSGAKGSLWRRERSSASALPLPASTRTST